MATEKLKINYKTKK